MGLDITPELQLHILITLLEMETLQSLFPNRYNEIKTRCLGIYHWALEPGLNMVNCVYRACNWNPVCSVSCKALLSGLLHNTSDSGKMQQFKVHEFLRKCHLVP